MRALGTGLVLGALVFLLPGVAWTAPADAEVDQAFEPAQPNRRDSGRLVVLGGLGVPDLVFVEADYSISRGLAITARAGGLPPLLNRISAGLLGLVPLSSDTALVPRHALGFQAEFSGMAVANVNLDDRVYGPGERPDDRTFRTTIGPTLSAGYLFTSLRGLHLRVMGGAFIPVVGDLDRPVANIQLGLGGLLR